MEAIEGVSSSVHHVAFLSYPTPCRSRQIRYELRVPKHQSLFVLAGCKRSQSRVGREAGTRIAEPVKRRRACPEESAAPAGFAPLIRELSKRLIWELQGNHSRPLTNEFIHDEE